MTLVVDQQAVTSNNIDAYLAWRLNDVSSKQPEAMTSDEKSYLITQLQKVVDEKLNSTDICKTILKDLENYQTKPGGAKWQCLVRGELADKIERMQDGRWVYDLKTMTKNLALAQANGLKLPVVLSSKKAHNTAIITNNEMPFYVNIIYKMAKAPKAWKEFLKQTNLNIGLVKDAISEIAGDLDDLVDYAKATNDVNELGAYLANKARLIEMIRPMELENYADTFGNSFLNAIKTTNVRFTPTGLIGKMPANSSELIQFLIAITTYVPAMQNDAYRDVAEAIISKVATERTGLIESNAEQVLGAYMALLALVNLDRIIANPSNLPLRHQISLSAFHRLIQHGIYVNGIEVDYANISEQQDTKTHHFKFDIAFKSTTYVKVVELLALMVENIKIANEQTGSDYLSFSRNKCNESYFEDRKVTDEAIFKTHKAQHRQLGIMQTAYAGKLNSAWEKVKPIKMTTHLAHSYLSGLSDLNMITTVSDVESANVALKLTTQNSLVLLFKTAEPTKELVLIEGAIDDLVSDLNDHHLKTYVNTAINQNRLMSSSFILQSFAESMRSTKSTIKATQPLAQLTLANPAKLTRLIGEYYFCDNSRHESIGWCKDLRDLHLTLKPNDDAVRSAQQVALTNSAALGELEVVDYGAKIGSCNTGYFLVPDIKKASQTYACSTEVNPVATKWLTRLLVPSEVTAAELASPTTQKVLEQHMQTLPTKGNKTAQLKALTDPIISYEIAKAHLKGDATEFVTSFFLGEIAKTATKHKLSGSFTLRMPENCAAILPDYLKAALIYASHQRIGQLAFYYSDNSFYLRYGPAKTFDRTLTDLTTYLIPTPFGANIYVLPEVSDRELIYESAVIPSVNYDTKIVATHNQVSDEYLPNFTIMSLVAAKQKIVAISRQTSYLDANTSSKWVAGTQLPLVAGNTILKADPNILKELVAANKSAYEFKLKYKREINPKYQAVATVIEAVVLTDRTKVNTFSHESLNALIKELGKMSITHNQDILGRVGAYGGFTPIAVSLEPSTIEWMTFDREIHNKTHNLVRPVGNWDYVKSFFNKISLSIAVAGAALVSAAVYISQSTTVQLLTTKLLVALYPALMGNLVIINLASALLATIGISSLALAAYWLYSLY